MASPYRIDADGQAKMILPLRSRFAISRSKQKRAMRQLEKAGFVRHMPAFGTCESVLIVGAGPSADKERLRDLVPQYDMTIAINSARENAPDADVMSYELAYRHNDVRAGQFAEIDSLDHDRLIIKPYSLTALDGEEIARVREAWQRNGAGAPRFLPHYQMPPKLAAREPQILLPRDRVAIQWRGSLTVWLDCCWLAGVGRVGLIGTDMGTIGEDGGFKHHLTNQDSESGPGVLSLLDTLRGVGYLRGIKFEHHHPNPKLSAVLGPD